VFARPVVPLLMLVFLLANFVATIFLTWTPTFLVEKFHFGLTGAGLSGAAPSRSPSKESSRSRSPSPSLPPIPTVRRSGLYQRPR